MSDLAAALQIAIRVHADQRDKQGEPYLLHVLRVVEAVSGEAKVVAALHDVCEDGWDASVLASVASLDNYEGYAVVLLTRPPDSHYFDYIRRIAMFLGESGRIAREVKLADLRDNLGRIPPVDGTWITDSEAKSWASLKGRYEKAIETLESSRI